MRNAQKKKENLGEREPLVFLLISLVSRTVTKVALLFIRNLHLNNAINTLTMSAKLMDATPDLKRLAPVENLAIDVISYAHGSVTPTLTNLYTKGKDSFLKVSKSSSSSSCSSSWCLSLSFLFFFHSSSSSN